MKMDRSMSFVLKKIFNMRDKASKKRGQGDVEKPFLEHLEDLRKTLLVPKSFCPESSYM